MNTTPVLTLGSLCMALGFSLIFLELLHKEGYADECLTAMTTSIFGDTEAVDKECTPTKVLYLKAVSPYLMGK